MSDGDSFYQKVRRETARLLGYEGTDNLPADQATRLDLATALRLGLDDMQARLLRGESLDVSKMLAATSKNCHGSCPRPSLPLAATALPRGSGCEHCAGGDRG
jgi:hypothetical protein